MAIERRAVEMNKRPKLEDARKMLNGDLWVCALCAPASLICRLIHTDHASKKA